MTNQINYSKFTGPSKVQLERVLLGTSNAGIVVADKDQRIIWLNAIAGEWLDFDPEFGVGRVITTLFEDTFSHGRMSVQDIISHIYAEPDATEQGKITSDVIIEVGWRVLRVRVAPMMRRAEDAENAHFEGLTVWMHDITAQVEAEREKSEFVSNVSHELRRPLTAIKGYSDLLLFSGIGPLNVQQEHFLRIMQDNANRLVSLANDLLDISHIESGRLLLDYASVLVDKIARDVVKAMQPTCDKRGVHLTLQIEPHIWPVWGDKNRLQQVMQNLLNHAVQSTPEGGDVTVAVGCSDKAVRVDITDSGPGIPLAEQSKLFQHFYRINNPALTEGIGTGLGLPIAKRLVEMHGGSLLVNSSVGAGSTFTYVLPRQDSIDTESYEQSLDQDRRSTVLVVEDERDISELIALQLRTEGYEVLTTAHGEQALAWAQEYPIDLITLDMMLPDITGMEVLRRLKSDNATADIPVIVVSVIQPKLGGASWGATEHISKPFALDKLMDSVRRTIANVKRGRLTPVAVMEQT